MSAMDETDKDVIAAAGSASAGDGGVEFDVDAVLAELRLGHREAARLIGVRATTIQRYAKQGRSSDTVRRLLLAMKRDPSLIDFLRELPRPTQDET